MFAFLDSENLKIHMNGISLNTDTKFALDHSENGTIVYD